jgi:hypothetical protein
MALQLSVLNTTIIAYLRQLLDTAGYNAVTVHKNKEPSGTPLPLVRFTLMNMDLTGNIVIDRSDSESHYRVFLTVGIFGSLEGNGRQEAEAVASVLRNGFIKGNITNINSTIITDLTTNEDEGSQVYQAVFTSNVVIKYP